MTNILDFIKAALPWIVMGLFVAISAVRIYVNSNDNAGTDKDSYKWFKFITPIPGIGALILCLWDFSLGNTSSATVWLVLGFAFLAQNMVFSRKNEKH